MTKHTITRQTSAILGDSYGCSCGTRLVHRMAAELHAAEQQLCSVCLGTREEEIVPEVLRDCSACAGTGRRREQVVWQFAHAEAEQVITMALVRGVVSGFDGPFRLSEIADTVRDGLGLPGGRLPVGPRVRDLLLEMQAQGEIAMLSAPDELLDSTANVVLYRDPQWQRTGTLEP